MSRLSACSRSLRAFDTTGWQDLRKKKVDSDSQQEQNGNGGGALQNQDTDLATAGLTDPLWANDELFSFQS